MAKKIRVTQIRNGKRVTFLTPDKGKPGKTPEAEQWYQPGVETGWKKDMPGGERRRLVLQAHKGDELSSARSMQAKANVTTDRETKQKARADAQYFFRRHKVGKRPTTPKPKAEKVEVAPEATTRERAIQMTRKEYADIHVANMGKGGEAFRASFESDHYRFVRRAVSEGKPVPTKVLKDYPDLKSVTPRARGVTKLQRIHARRSTQARIRDEQQSHQVTIEVDSPRVKVWLKDPSAADIKGIDTPKAKSRRGGIRITPKTPKLRR